MHKCLALCLTLLVLLQSFSREVLVLDYALHKERVTQLFCVNKDKPQLRCNGKCHLRKQLNKQTAGERKAPDGAHGKVKFEALSPVASQLAAPGQLRRSARPSTAVFAR